MLLEVGDIFVSSLCCSAVTKLAPSQTVTGPKTCWRRFTVCRAEQKQSEQGSTVDKNERLNVLSLIHSSVLLLCRSVASAFRRHTQWQESAAKVVFLGGGFMTSEKGTFSEVICSQAKTLFVSPATARPSINSGTTERLSDKTLR